MLEGLAPMRRGEKGDPGTVMNQGQCSRGGEKKKKTERLSEAIFGTACSSGGGKESRGLGIVQPEECERGDQDGKDAPRRPNPNPKKNDENNEAKKSTDHHKKSKQGRLKKGRLPEGGLAKTFRVEGKERQPVLDCRLVSYSALAENGVFPPGRGENTVSERGGGGSSSTSYEKLERKGATYQVFSLWEKAKGIG